jgi:hypothetical protein
MGMTASYPGDYPAGDVLDIQLSVHNLLVVHPIDKMMTTLRASTSTSAFAMSVRGEAEDNCLLLVCYCCCLLVRAACSCVLPARACCLLVLLPARACCLLVLLPAAC